MAVAVISGYRHPCQWHFSSLTVLLEQYGPVAVKLNGSPHLLYPLMKVLLITRLILMTSSASNRCYTSFPGLHMGCNLQVHHHAAPGVTFTADLAFGGREMLKTISSPHEFILCENKESSAGDSVVPKFFKTFQLLKNYFQNLKLCCAETRLELFWSTEWVNHFFHESLRSLLYSWNLLRLLRLFRYMCSLLEKWKNRIDYR